MRAPIQDSWISCEKPEPGDRFFQPGNSVWQYVATYRFNDLAKTPLKKGQITAQGVFLLEDLINLQAPRATN